MGYIQDFERELKDLLENADNQAVIRFVKEKVIESYRNGIMAAKMVDADKEADRKVKRFGRGK